MDLATKYLGLDLSNPFVPSASPLSRSLDQARALEDHGASAIILWSLFEEAVSAESEAMVRFLHHQEIGFAEADDGFLPDYHDFDSPLEQYLAHIGRLKAALDIPVIASLNGVTPGGWIAHAGEIERAGADALELNVYYVAGDIGQDGATVEARYLDLLRDLRAHVAIPINMKLSPSFSSLGHLIGQLAAAGANGVALFNRFYQPDINIDTLRLQPSLHPSTSAEALLAMRWIALLHGRFEGLSLGATGGVHTAADAIKLLLAGADVVHLCSALLAHGPAYLGEVIGGVEQWMEEQGFESVEDFRGRVSALAVPNPAEFERANYVNVLDSYSASPGVRL
ncbi:MULTISPECIES: dihydroorotate dehydrogenase-like protein [unclassified Marichromatium]|uniref:dihydroorotate dehydrogenase-like protein n=1 Tax=unclassified Marichromatium TaxID=2618417 RepID=UPI000F3ACC92|nr:MULTISPECIES: dihydroorotate dehydrogenase-like protein [unclassified Marichromatium]MBO8084766.1 dihydroorotate dehydrogenase-like protein [Marichromatium sp.]RNE90172.1 dihydroorotate dehydrogenase-like protein [Marichromatium sp. AB31]RNE93461.1 dihydroorotate dehydrogenase-like protein [Marichromatium sp. AB32]